MVGPARIPMSGSAVELIGFGVVWVPARAVVQRYARTSCRRDSRPVDRGNRGVTRRRAARPPVPPDDACCEHSLFRFRYDQSLPMPPARRSCGRAASISRMSRLNCLSRSNRTTTSISFRPDSKSPASNSHFRRVIR